MRDRQLDIYRALLMLYITCIAHNAYWLGNGTEPFLSIILFVIPQVFFVSGAALSLHKSTRSIWSTIINRFKRIVVPFYIYAAVMLGGIGVLSTLLLKGTEFFRLLPFDILAYTWRDALDVLLCLDLPHCPFMAHLWFIPLYLVLSCTFPLQIKLMEHINRYIYLAASVIIFLLAQGFTHISFLRELLCYNAFMVAGYLFYKRDNQVLTALLGVGAAVLLLANEFVLGGHFCPIQDHKFPPDWVYFTYNVMMLCLLSLVLRRITLPYNKVFKIWNERGYTIYLYQSLGLWFVYGIHQTGLFNSSSNVVNFIVDGLLVFALLTAMSRPAYSLERWVMRHLPSSK